MRESLRQQLRDNAYPGYVYGYPHKKAYRPLPRALPLEEVWADEARDALFCYVHVPFCNQRCSFCNLFTYVPGGSPTADYLDALAREMAAYAKALPGAAADGTESQAAALAYVDSQLPPLLAALRARGECFCLFLADHGEAYGEDGRWGHRLAHPTVTTVPYAHFFL